MSVPFRDRRDAGKRLAAQLKAYAGRSDVLVLALPRGGVPVAYEVAEAIGAPLDVVLIRKLGVPGREELAMGAIASGGVRVLNPSVVEGLGIPDAVIEEVAAAEERELSRRERLYRGAHPAPDVLGKIVILVDDGLATGSTMRAAVEAIRAQGPSRIVAAVPVAAPVVCEAIQEVADETVCAVTPEPFDAVGYWYEDFSPTSDEEVRDLLGRSGRWGHPPDTEPPPPTGSARSAGTDPVGDAIRAAAIPVTGAASDHDRLLDLIGDARFVLIGDATHGTEEFYRERAEITRRLIRERGFSALAVEADWPHAERVDRYVRGREHGASPEKALGGFEGFPRWMWRNTVVRDVVAWLREHNDALPDAAKVGFYGLDLYSLNASIAAVVGYLDEVDPEAARRARARYGCFDHFGDDAQDYGYVTGLGAAEPCEEEVVAQLLELQRLTAELAGRDGRGGEDAIFSAEQNARLARDAEAYYRSLFRGRASSWNLRDRHMADTLDAVTAHLDRRLGRSKVVVWAHNSHLGDARATDMGRAGELNLGQLVRERAGDDAVLVGFTTYAGTVSAASDWGGPAERKRVRPALPGSYEALLHGVGIPAFLLPLRDGGEAAEALRQERLERAIGVVYRPETERVSHYLHARLADQFDAVIHLDATTALRPLDADQGWERGEALDTFPFGV